MHRSACIIVHRFSLEKWWVDMCSTNKYPRSIILPKSAMLEVCQSCQASKYIVKNEFGHFEMSILPNKPFIYPSSSNYQTPLHKYVYV